MKKRIGALLIMITILASVFSACGMPTTKPAEESKQDTSSSREVSTESKPVEPSESATEENITLRVVDWSDSTADHRKKFHADFEEKNPGTTVDYTMLTTDQFKNTIMTMIKSGDGPDLFPIPGGMTLGMALKENWYQPMTSYLSEDFIAKIQDQYLIEGATTSDGEIYVLTESAATPHNLLFYNKTLLQQAGITELPKTYSEFIDANKKITQQGAGAYYGYLEGGQQMNRMSILIRAFALRAGEKIAPNGQAITNNNIAPYATDATLGVYELFRQLSADGSIHPDSINIGAPEAREYFAQGQAAFLMQGMWCIPVWDENSPDLDYGVMSVPYPDGVTPGGVHNDIVSPWLGIYSQSAHGKTAGAYLDALYSSDYTYQMDCVTSGSFVSILPEINNEYMVNQRTKEYYQLALQDGVVFPEASARDEKVNDFYTEVKDIQPGLGDILQGVMSDSSLDYKAQLDILTALTTAEWNRAAEAVGISMDVFEFPNWDVTKDYTAEDYAALG